MPSGNILPPLRPTPSPPRVGTADPRATIPFTLELEENRHSQLCRERHLSLMNHMRTLWSHIFTTDRYHRSIHRTGRQIRITQQNQLESIEQRQDIIEKRQDDIEKRLNDIKTQKVSIIKRCSYMLLIIWFIGFEAVASNVSHTVSSQQSGNTISYV